MSGLRGQQMALMTCVLQLLGRSYNNFSETLFMPIVSHVFNEEQLNTLAQYIADSRI